MRQTTRVVLAVLMVLAGGALAAADVSGRVYVDGNANRRLDAGETGLSGVLVSDGRQVVATDAEGRYRLPTTEPRVLLWICVPRDHAAPAGFWRWSDDAHDENFPLVRRTQGDNFLFVQITDTHVGRVDLVQELVARLNTFPRPLAFVVNTGDLVAGSDTVLPDKARTQYKNYLTSVASLKLPLWNIPGNHEHVAHNVKNADQTDPLYGKGMYRQLLGPMHYTWDWGPVHFIALDGTTLPYKQKLGAEQLAWLEADLKHQPGDKPLVLFCHQPIPDLADAAELEGLLRARRVLGAFCGHLHRTFSTRWAGTTVYQTGAMSGAWWSAANPDGTPQGFRLVQIERAGLKTAYFNREGREALAIIEPSASTVLSGRVEFAATMLDFGKLVEMSARFEGRGVGMELDHREPLWSIWKGSVDTRTVYDGPRVLKLATQAGNETSWTETRYLVVNGRAEPYQATGPAVLKLQVRGVDAADELLWNGRALGTLPPKAPKDSVVRFSLPAERLLRVNRLTIRAVPQRGNQLDGFSVGPISLDYRGQTIHDLRYPGFERYSLGNAKGARCRPQHDVYLCLP
jgi:hypothetical protein